MFQYKVLEWKVVDGDTVDLVLDVGFRHTIKDRFRLFGPDPAGKDGINAPELNSAEGQIARDQLYLLLGDVTCQPMVLIAHTVKDKKEKFGRWLVTLIATSLESGRVVNINAKMVESGHAVLKRY